MPLLLKINFYIILPPMLMYTMLYLSTVFFPTETLHVYALLIPLILAACCPSRPLAFTRPKYMW
jgi:hypothetical protein